MYMMISTGIKAGESKDVDVPEFVGKMYDQIKADKSYKFKFEISADYVKDKPINVVLKQDPAPVPVSFAGTLHRSCAGTRSRRIFRNRGRGASPGFPRGSALAGSSKTRGSFPPSAPGQEPFPPAARPGRTASCRTGGRCPCPRQSVRCRLSIRHFFAA